jgi:DnaJ family protein C protein 28
MDDEIQEKQARLPVRRVPPKARADMVEDAIREAMARGDFDNLPGKGRPLQMEGNPQDDQFLAKKLLKDAGFVPAWLDLEREIQQERKACDAWFARFRDRYSSVLQRIDRESADATHLRAAFARELARTREDYRLRLESIGKKILRFNLIVPVKSRQLAGPRIAETLVSFDQEFPLA